VKENLRQQVEPREKGAEKGDPAVGVFSEQASVLLGKARDE
jgi:hypothetical protein